MDSLWPSLKDVLLTTLRWSSGVAIGAAVALIASVVEAVVRGALRLVRLAALSGALTIPFDFLRALPVIALVPLVQLIGVDEWWKFALIAWAATFPIWLRIRQAWLQQMIDTELALKASGLRRIDIFRSYDFPKALGGLLQGIEISIGIAWISTVAAEWIGTFSTGFWAGGLGYKVQVAHDANNWGAMLACLGYFGALGIASTSIWRKLVLRK
jgi:sulfonate transport system permease protein